MRFTTACLLALLACTACATSGKPMPTVENNVVSYRNFRDITIDGNYEFEKSFGKDYTTSAVETLTISTQEDVAVTVFRTKNPEDRPAMVMLIYGSLPDRWMYQQIDKSFYVTLGGHEYRAQVRKVIVDGVSYYRISAYFYPMINRLQLTRYYFPTKNIPDEEKDEEARTNYVIAKMQSAIVEF